LFTFVKKSFEVTFFPVQKLNAEPEKLFVPDFVTALTIAPETVRDDLYFGYGLICRACLSADVRPALLVGVVRAVEDDVIGGGRLSVRLEGVVKKFGARNEHRPRHVTDKGHVVPVGRREIVQLIRRDMSTNRR
jgi:hypothetical protein